MPSENAENTGLKRRQAVVEMLFKHRDWKPDAFYMLFEEDQLIRHPLLSDFSALIKALDRMQEELKPDFEYKQVWGSGTRSGDIGYSSGYYIGIGISVDNWVTLKEYRNELAKEAIEPKKKQKTISTGSTGKTPVIVSAMRGIFRSDGEGERYKISGTRLQIVSLIAREKSVRQKKIAALTKYTPSEISNEIKAINKMFTNKTRLAFNFIDNTSSRGGYHLNDEDLAITIELKPEVK